MPTYLEVMVNDVVLLRRAINPIALFRPAVETWSMVCIGLGAAFALVTVMVVWVSTPETLSLSPFNSHFAVIRGGQAFADIAPAVRREFLSAVLLLAGGTVGLLATRSDPVGVPEEVEGRGV